MSEGLSEIGGALGDATMHHSNAKNGEDYANNVTKVYVKAAGEIGHAGYKLGVAGYKVGNIAVMSFGGLPLETVVGSAAGLMGVHDYLVGPVLLQGYMHMIRAPSTVPTMYFVVLR